MNYLISLVFAGSWCFTSFWDMFLCKCFSLLFNNKLHVGYSRLIYTSCGQLSYLKFYFQFLLHLWNTMRSTFQPMSSISPMAPTLFRFFPFFPLISTKTIQSLQLASRPPTSAAHPRILLTHIHWSPLASAFSCLGGLFIYSYEWGMQTPQSQFIYLFTRLAKVEKPNWTYDGPSNILQIAHFDGVHLQSQTSCGLI